ncbi:MAG: mannitol dehydrogenase family protein [Massiliimalia sp.]|jgi:fructuronate reductase
MHLSQVDLKNRDIWLDQGIQLPEYSLDEMKQITKKHPRWIHFGAGNLFRAFPAMIQHRLLSQGKAEYGVVVAEGFDREIIDRVYRPYDCLSLLAVLKGNGTVEKKVVGSVADALEAFPDSPDWKKLMDYFADPQLQMVSFTITEKGYGLTDIQGNWLPAVERDFSHMEAPEHIMGKIAALCLHRYEQGGAAPLALVSMDNCSHNGEKLQNAVLAIANQWVQRGLVSKGFYEYLSDPKQVAFPWSMIDKITPRPDETVKADLEQCGFEDTQIIITSHKTYTAPFVNAEEAEYLVIEDSFPNGRPPLEEGGVIFTTRETVNTTERMKVCTCLNPLHTALAIFGCLLSYSSIWEEMKDPELKQLVYRLGYQEGLPVVEDPKIIHPQAFLQEVLEKRLPNPFIPDTPQRIATDTSQKLSVRFGETIKAYLESPDKNVEDLQAIPLVFAGWCRYLLELDDQQKPFDMSPDPMKETLQHQMEGISCQDPESVHEKLAPILSNSTVFGVNLETIGMSEAVERYFIKMTSGAGMVRKTLQDFFKQEALL